MPASRPARALRICGELTIDGEPVPVAGRATLLLVVLATRGAHGIGRAELTELLWPDDPPAAGTAALDPLISRLRRSIGSIRGRGSVALDGDVEIDAHVATAALGAAGETDDAARAVDLALGAARTLSRPLAPALDHPWVLAQRAELQRRAVDALALAARAGLRTPAAPPDGAVDAARELVAARPHDEQHAALLIDLLFAAGDRGAALQAYEDARARLRDDLAITPGPDLRERHLRLMRSDAHGLGGTRPALPPALSTTAGMALVGRDGVLLSARRALRDARLVAITGPPGIGKTHLAATLAAERYATGATVLLARATQVAAAPFAGLSAALGALVADADPSVLAATLGPLAADLEPAVPLLAQRLGDMLPDRPATPDPSMARLRLFDAAAALLAAADGGDGVLLVVDDLQDLDASSVQLLAHLLNAGVPGLSVLATSRPMAQDPLGSALDRHLARRVELGPLDEEALGTLVRLHHPELAAGDARARAGDLLARTGGTPLLACTELAAPAGAEGLRDAVAAMLGWAGADASTLLRVAALDDAGAPLDVLARAAGIDETAAGIALDRARVAGLVTAVDSVHATVNDVLVAEVGDAQRAEVHRRLAEAYEAVGAGPAPIAAHWARGGTAASRRRAAFYEERAARDALDALAVEAADEHADRALALLDSPPLERQADLLALRGRALNGASRLADARTVLRDAQQCARQAARDDLVAQIAAEIAGHRLGAGLVDPELIALVDEGLTSARTALDMPDLRLQARLAARLATLLLDGPLHRRDALVAEAEDLARRSGAPAEIAEALLARHIGDVFRADPAARLVLLEEADGLARAAGRADLALHARMLRFSDRLEAGDVAAARDEARVWDDEAARARLPYHRWAVAVCQPTLELIDGRPDRAFARLDVAKERARALGDDPVVRAGNVGQQMILAASQGRLDEPIGLLRGIIAANSATPAWSACLGYMLALEGDDGAALAAVADALRAGIDTMVDPNRGAALSFLADAAVLSGASSAAMAEIEAALGDREGTLIVQHYGGCVHGAADARRARLAAARGDWAGAAAHVRRAGDLLGPSPPAQLAIDFAWARAEAAGERTDDARAGREAVVGNARAHGLVALADALGRRR